MSETRARGYLKNPLLRWHGCHAPPHPRPKEQRQAPFPDGRQGRPGPRSAQPPGLAFRLQQGENVALAHRALHVADDGAARVVHELHTHLRGGTASARPGPARGIAPARPGPLT